MEQSDRRAEEVMDTIETMIAGQTVAAAAAAESQQDVGTKDTEDAGDRQGCLEIQSDKFEQLKREIVLLAQECAILRLQIDTQHRLAAVPAIPEETPEATRDENDPQCTESPEQLEQQYAALYQKLLATIIAAAREAQKVTKAVASDKPYIKNAGMCQLKEVLAKIAADNRPDSPFHNAPWTSTSLLLDALEKAAKGDDYDGFESL